MSDLCSRCRIHVPPATKAIVLVAAPDVELVVRFCVQCLRDLRDLVHQHIDDGLKLRRKTAEFPALPDDT